MPNSNNERKSILIFAAVATIPIIWLGLLIAPYTDGGLITIIGSLSVALSSPFSITLCKNSFLTVLVFLVIYGIVILVFLSEPHNYRYGKEYGSAKWGVVSEICKKFADPVFSENKLVTQNFRMGLNGHKHKRNLNTIVEGGSGSGKTQSYVLPNLMQCNTSFFVLDPKGEILRCVGSLLKDEGYTIHVLDLISLEKSDGYNPFAYIRGDDDIQRLATNIFKATTPPDSHSGDPFWDTAAEMLLMALMMYLYHEAPPNEQNFGMAMEMLRAGKPIEDSGMPSPLSLLFEELREKKPNHIALKYYDNYNSGSEKTLQSIQIILASHLEKFNLDSVVGLTSIDEMDLSTMGEKKTALFALIPDNDTSYNFLVSMLYTQLFQQLFFCADFKHGGRLPVPVHLMMDEFANVSLPDDFPKILAVMRSRQVFASIILQNLQQLNKLFEKDAKSMVGNCDLYLYLGGNEDDSHERLSKMLNKETIDTKDFSKTHGGKGSYSTSYRQTGRELMTVSEMREMSNDHAIVMLRGTRPIMDHKFDVTKHPNVHRTARGGGRPYIHGLPPENSVSVTPLTYEEYQQALANGETIEAFDASAMLDGYEVSITYGGSFDEDKKNDPEQEASQLRAEINKGKRELELKEEALKTLLANSQEESDDD